jgi:hypothetical protein
MRAAGLTARACLSALLLLGALVEPLRAQEDGGSQSPRNEVRGNTGGIEPRVGRRLPLGERRELPAHFEREVRQLSPAERRVVMRKLRRMSPNERQEFMRDFERMPARERGERIDALRRRPRELPEALRTPEMRQRLREMSPQERREFFRHAREWREMPARERGRMRSRLERFGALSEADQRTLVDEKFASRSPEQREQLLRDLRSAAERMRERRARGEAAREAPAAEAP